MKAWKFEVRDYPFICRGKVLVTGSQLEDMYKKAKYEWEQISDGKHDNFYCDRVHTLEAMIQESRKGKYIFMNTSKY